MGFITIQPLLDVNCFIREDEKMKNKELMKLQVFAEPELPKSAGVPEINYETEAFINTAPKEEEPVWASMGALMKNMSSSLNEVLVQGAYYADKGWGSTHVTGGQLTLTVSGDVKKGDAASEYILSDEVMLNFGAARETHLKLKKGNKVIIWPVTLANITPAYGDANQPNALTVTIHGNGRPAIGTVE